MKNPKFLYIGHGLARLNDPAGNFALMENPCPHCYRVEIPADMKLRRIAPKANGFFTDDLRRIRSLNPMPVVMFNGKLQERPGLLKFDGLHSIQRAFERAGYVALHGHAMTREYCNTQSGCIGNPAF